MFYYVVSLKLKKLQFHCQFLFWLKVNFFSDLHTAKNFFLALNSRKLSLSFNIGPAISKCSVCSSVVCFCQVASSLINILASEHPSIQQRSLLEQEFISAIYTACFIEPGIPKVHFIQNFLVLCMRCINFTL